MDDCCGAEPPQGPQRWGQWGDCWCTRDPDHEGQHLCEPCVERGAPGWD